MGNWDSYKREEREEQSNVTGKQRCVITAVEETTTKSTGKPMIVVSLRPSGRKFSVKHYIVQNEYFNRNMTQFFDAFPEIDDGDFNFLGWVGCEGAAMFGEDDQGFLKVKYFLDPVRASSLPPFEGDKPERQTITSLDEKEDDDGDLPF